MSLDLHDFPLAELPSCTATMNLYLIGITKKFFKQPWHVNAMEIPVFSVLHVVFSGLFVHPNIASHFGAPIVRLSSSANENHSFYERTISQTIFVVTVPSQLVVQSCLLPPAKLYPVVVQQGLFSLVLGTWNFWQLYQKSSLCFQPI